MEDREIKGMIGLGQLFSFRGSRHYACVYVRGGSNLRRAR